MNCWGFTPDFFLHLEEGFHSFISKHAQTLKGEYYIPSVVNHLINTRQATVKVLQSPAKWFGVTYREDRQHAVNQLLDMTKQGTYPENLWA